MSIRKQVTWTGTKFTGYVDIGANIDSDTLPEAREAIAFMLLPSALNHFLRRVSSVLIVYGIPLINYGEENREAKQPQPTLSTATESLTIETANQPITSPILSSSGAFDPTDVRVSWVYLLKKEELITELRKFNLDTAGTANGRKGYPSVNDHTRCCVSSTWTTNFYDRLFPRLLFHFRQLPRLCPPSLFSLCRERDMHSSGHPNRPVVTAHARVFSVNYAADLEMEISRRLQRLNEPASRYITDLKTPIRRHGTMTQEQELQWLYRNLRPEKRQHIRKSGNTVVISFCRTVLEVKLLLSELQASSTRHQDSYRPTPHNHPVNKPDTRPRHEPPLAPAIRPPGTGKCATIAGKTGTPEKIVEALQGCFVPDADDGTLCLKTVPAPSHDRETEPVLYDRPHARIYIGGYPFLALVDTGAANTYIGTGAQKFAGFLIPLSHPLSEAKKSPMDVDGENKLFSAINIRSDITYIVGIDILTRNRFRLELGTGDTFLDNQLISPPTPCSPIGPMTDGKLSLTLTKTEELRLKQFLDLAKHHMNLLKSEPIKQRHRPQNPRMQEIINAEVKTMLAEGIIEPFASAWSSTVVIVRKKDGDHRFYRPGNGTLPISRHAIWRNIPGLIIRLKKHQNIEKIKEDLRKQIVRASQRCHIGALGGFKTFLIDVKLEEKFLSRPLSIEDQRCEESFLKTTTQRPDGHFVVQLLFRHSESYLGHSKEIAIKRFLNLERKLNRNPSLKSDYSKFLEEYEALGHMIRTNFETLENKSTCFLPHHGVINNTSETTKLRVVFDGSSTGYSLNDILIVGPTVQQNLFSIVLRARKHEIMLPGNIAKMYRQVYVHETQWNLQVILWRPNPSVDIQPYMLKTVTYGTAPASHLATRCLKELSIRCSQENSIISRIIAEDFYVDDLCTGGSTVQEVLNIKQQVSRILLSAGFELRKFYCNVAEVIENTLEQTVHIGESSSNKKLEKLGYQGTFWLSYMGLLMRMRQDMELAFIYGQLMATDIVLFLCYALKLESLQ
ncbi:hypothetical protein HUJ05_002115 [Dendroctonus ponderosae]|nr:hypothetical protein HUJ05_002115 [Dendroctonus ponderosae]